MNNPILLSGAKAAMPQGVLCILRGGESWSSPQGKVPLIQGYAVAASVLEIWIVLGPKLFDRNGSVLYK